MSQSSEVIICQDLAADITRCIEQCHPDCLYVLTDRTTHDCCLPLLQGIEALKGAQHICIEPTDDNKNIETLCGVWQQLSQSGASRHSLLINLGGGMVTDLGGFAASTFKRGIAYINIPTTLLSMVDAAVGGKTAINFNGLKNEIGVFQVPRSVIISARFLRSLDVQNLLSGYAEMLKHGLISDADTLGELLAFDATAPELDYDLLQRLIARSVAVKERIVLQDPKEQGIRKALNLGHTVGHAFESLALARKQPVLHGYAVAWGLACELYLSVVLTGFPKERMRSVVQFVHSHYGVFNFTCDDYERLYEFMKHDKKNAGGIINFTLLGNVGEICLDQTAGKELLFEMFDFFRESMGM